MESSQYVHGYSSRETDRLNEQANTLEDFIHHDTLFPQGSLVLEAGCGVGAQTKIIARKNPQVKFISIDVSEDSLQQVEKMLHSVGITNVGLQQADLYQLPFANETFDSIIVCFVLEHLQYPLRALEELQRVLKKNATIVVIEGDHGSAFFSPDSKAARQAISCLVTLQRKIGGNSIIGRSLYPLLYSTGFSSVVVSPRMVYVDASKGGLVEGFIKNTFIPMIEAVGEKAIQEGIVDKLTFEQGIRDLYRTAEADGTFCYTFFKALAVKS